MVIIAAACAELTSRWKSWFENQAARTGVVGASACVVSGAVATSASACAVAGAACAMFSLCGTPINIGKPLRLEPKLLIN